MPNPTTDMVNARALAEINKGLSMAAECVEKCDIAEDCWCPLADRREVIEEQRQKLLRAKERLFPSAQ